MRREHCASPSRANRESLDSTEFDSSFSSSSSSFRAAAAGGGDGDSRMFSRYNSDSASCCVEDTEKCAADDERTTTTTRRRTRSVELHPCALDGARYPPVPGMWEPNAGPTRSRRPPYLAVPSWLPSEGNTLYCNSVM